MDCQMAVSEYVKHCIASASFADFLRPSELVRRLSFFLSASIIGLFVLLAVRSYCCVWLGKYLVRHCDVVKLGSITDDLFCLCNSVVSIQPYNGLRQQPARIKTRSLATA